MRARLPVSVGLGDLRIPVDRSMWVGERPPFVLDLLTGPITKPGVSQEVCGKGQVVSGTNHVASQPMQMTKCLVSDSIDYDASAGE